ncbi:MAG: hypothetical protein WCE62_22085 [Polyangiales bacterium]
MEKAVWLDGWKISFAVSALLALTGISQCEATCGEILPDGTVNKWSCTICDDFSGNPCAGMRWTLPGGSQCTLDNQPKTPDGTECDVDEGSGVCMSGVCVVDIACGDGVTNGTESCDDGPNNGAGDGFCLDDCSATQVCGDGTTNGTEFCEAIDMVDCTTLGFIGGTAACNATCDAWNESSCTMLDDCGNGVADPGELCDDGVNMGGEGNCLACNGLQTCGDGASEGTETCDDGANNGSGNGLCLSDCSATQPCGDGTTNGTESCDDGTSNGTGNGFCLSDCSTTQTCGDGTTNGTEFCESSDSVECTSLSGGFIGGDALCDAACAAWDASTCTTAADCGNDFLDPGESCDDGVNDGGEGECLACMGLQSCGDGTSEGTEACDAGAQNGTGDGICLADCSGTQSCGDGVQNGTEICDDGTNDGGPNGCLPGCQSIQICGDGTQDGTEACDDGANNGSGDGFCLADCSGTQTCGDGVPNGTELCDVGDTIACTAVDPSFLGGTALCGASCSAWALSTCTTAANCGNGIVDDGELCDDGSNMGGEGLCVACQAIQSCGDGTRNGTEQCDDGNLADGDGCQSDCTIWFVSCDITAATCGTGESCYPTGAGDLCLPTGTLPEGSVCSSVNDCQAGIGCVAVPTDPVNPHCAALCDSSIACADGDPCVDLSAPSNLSACLLDTCDLFAQDCGAGQGCYPATVTSAGGTTFDGNFCWYAGSGAAGDPCTEAAECAAGLACVTDGAVELCLEICDLSNPSCPAGTTCQTTSNPGFGACKTDSP